MSEIISERYQKTLVTVAMGFRTEEDIRKNGLYRFTVQDSKELIEYVNSLFDMNNKVLALKIKPKGYRSQHISINSKEELNQFKENIPSIFGKENEIWIVSSASIECWRCRLYLSENGSNDMFEMAYSYDDHILDHLDSNFNVPYAYYQKRDGNFSLVNTTLNEDRLQESKSILDDILNKYSNVFKTVRQDLTFMNLDGISLDILVNGGYEIHDFDVVYSDVKKVVDYYLPQIKVLKKHYNRIGGE